MGQVEVAHTHVVPAHVMYAAVSLRIPEVIRGESARSICRDRYDWQGQYAVTGMDGED